MGFSVELMALLIRRGAARSEWQARCTRRCLNRCILLRQSCKPLPRKELLVRLLTRSRLCCNRIPLWLTIVGYPYELPAADQHLQAQCWRRRRRMRWGTRQCPAKTALLRVHFRRPTGTSRGNHPDLGDFDLLFLNKINLWTFFRSLALRSWRDFLTGISIASTASIQRDHLKRFNYFAYF